MDSVSFTILVLTLDTISKYIYKCLHLTHIALSELLMLHGCGVSGQSQLIEPLGLSWSI